MVKCLWTVLFVSLFEMGVAPTRAQQEMRDVEQPRGVIALGTLTHKVNSLLQCDVGSRFGLNPTGALRRLRRSYRRCDNRLHEAKMKITLTNPTNSLEHVADAACPLALCLMVVGCGLGICKSV